VHSTTVFHRLFAKNSGENTQKKRRESFSFVFDDVIQRKSLLSSTICRGDVTNRGLLIPNIKPPSFSIAIERGWELEMSGKIRHIRGSPADFPPEVSVKAPDEVGRKVLGRKFASEPNKYKHFIRRNKNSHRNSGISQQKKFFVPPGPRSI
jgi:hypothetical protein